MSVQRIIILGFCLLPVTALFAQKIHFNQVLGLSGSTSKVSRQSTLHTDTSTINSDYQLRLNQYGIVYSPRIDLISSSVFSVSVAAPFVLGFSTTGKYSSIDFNGVKKDTINGIKGTSFLFELPLVVDLNFGLNSAQDESRRAFGFYVGAGYAYTYTKIKTSLGAMPYDGFEPMLRAGIRMGEHWETRWSIGFSIKGDLRNNGIRAYGLQISKEL
jgi:hypothetical protein